MEYTETRQEAIKAIHGAISKWQTKCKGESGESDCALCKLYGELQHSAGCPDCPLVRCYGVNCLETGSHFDNWFHGDYGDKEPAEAMLEALVMLLPPEERKIYGG